MTPLDSAALTEVKNLAAESELSHIIALARAAELRALRRLHQAWLDRQAHPRRLLQAGLALPASAADEYAWRQLVLDSLPAQDAEALGVPDLLSTEAGARG